YHDVDVTAFGYEIGQIPGHPPLFTADQKSEEIAEKAFENLKKEGVLPSSVRCTRGIIGSGDSFMHNPERIMELKKQFPTVCAVEMEGAAIAHTCSLFGVPFVILRAISDVAGKESPYSFEEFLHLASHHSSVLVQKMLTLFGVSSK
ncbi:MAG: 5'-methylthioadenosine/S-adenosylhomocysteine nucleosidase, partial [Treponemataceae bacterium]|nr:5'-methylthioadenosine/S-adenosylhomocysteine nucleosidase [Treponemataceae bacterium]